MTLTLALLIAGYYGIYASQPFILLMGPSNFGAIIGLIVGVIMHNPAQGVVYGAWIQLLFLGVVNYGGTKAIDQFSASVIAIPVSIATQLPIPITLVLASIFGLISFPIDQSWKKINTEVWSKRIDLAIENLDFGSIFRCSSVYPMATRFLFSSTPAFFIIYFGSSIMAWFIKHAPHWLILGITNGGKLLPMLGIATFLFVIGKPNYLPYFFLGFCSLIFLNLDNIKMYFASVISCSLVVIIAAIADRLKSEVPHNDSNI